MSDEQGVTAKEVRTRMLERLRQLKASGSTGITINLIDPAADVITRPALRAKLERWLREGMKECPEIFEGVIRLGGVDYS